MKVAAILPLYPPKSRVGAWLATHELLRGLADRGHRVQVATFLRSAPSYDLDGIRVHGAPWAQTVAGDADVMVAHLGLSGPDALRRVWFRAPVVRMCHGLPFDERRLSNCALLVANSKATLAAFDAWPGRKIVCHPPTDPAAYRAAPGSMITAVNLSAEKGGDLFAAIARAMPGEGFLGVLGSHGDQLRPMPGNVEVIGPNVANMALAVYARTRILLCPSRAETWGMVGVEALASGIPVVARPLPGLRESLGRAGNWVDSDDPQEWATEIRRLDQPRARLGAAQRARRRCRELDPQGQRERFADAVEELVQ